MFRQLFPSLALLALMLTAPLAAAQAQNFDAIPADGASAAAQSQPAAPATPAVPSGTGACQDDPRLEGELLAILASDKPVSPPITVTPETFINLDPEILARLAGQMIICPNNPVLKSGKPMRKVVAPFEVIWDNLRKAAIAGDEARVKQVLTSYTAAPKTTEEIVNLLADVDLDEKVKNSLYKAAGMGISKVTGGQMIDFYTVLGGKPSDKKIVFMSNREDPSRLPEKFSADSENHKELMEKYVFFLGKYSYGSQHKGSYIDSLGRLGIATEHSDH
ncbi:MAG: hypothetical protein HDQ89_00065 [Desulfovibrio sp.]|nr:hypothetical protein [Desulfovibrio sp.]